MFIRRIHKNNGQSKKKYYYLHLVESIRTEKGPRQKLILNLGNLNIDPSQYQALAEKIQDILTGQKSFIGIDPNLEKIAKEAARSIFKKRAQEVNQVDKRQIEKVDINSLSISNARSIGAEYVCHSAWNWLNLDDFFLSNKITKNILPLIKALIISRLINAGSEQYIKGWVENRSSLYELCGYPLATSLNSYYRGTDKIFTLKEELEKHLSEKERDIFSLDETFYFYDLTNTYFEGWCSGSQKAKYGRSKEKRSDCKLLTLGMIVDQMGFSKYTEIFPGNQYEAETLSGIIKKLEKQTTTKKIRTVVIDAGIATTNNLKWLKENGYNYIAVNRGGIPFDKDFSDMKIIKEDAKKGIKIEIKRVEHNDEDYILCRSRKKQQKEESIRSRVEQLLCDRLEYYKKGLTKKNHTKNYIKLLEVIGRLKEKYPKAAKLYNIEVIPDKEGKKSNIKKLNAIDIKWEKNTNKYLDQQENEGTYVLRTDRKDLSKEKIWKIYIMSRRIESSFKDMKSHLGLRPNFHQLEDRIDAHMFISVIAYHIMHTIEQKLRLNGDNRSWRTIKNILSTHQRVTVSYKSLDEHNQLKQNHIRTTTNAEIEHIQIYKKLELPPTPLVSKKLIC